jgi:hypothetical protein
MHSTIQMGTKKGFLCIIVYLSTPGCIQNYLPLKLKTLDHLNPQITEHFLTSAMLVDFSQFCDIHHLIPWVLDLRPKHTTAYLAQTKEGGELGDIPQIPSNCF